MVGLTGGLKTKRKEEEEWEDAGDAGDAGDEGEGRFREWSQKHKENF